MAGFEVIIEEIPDREAARKAACLLVPELNATRARSEPATMTVAQLCSHFDQRELCLANTWRSYSTKHIYKVYLRRWIVPRWGEHLLSDIRTIEVESWLRGLAIARSTCKDSQCHVGIVQSCLQIRVLQPKPYSTCAPNFTNAPVALDVNGKPILDAEGHPDLQHVMTGLHPQVHTVMQQMRAHIDTFNTNTFPGTRVLIGETGGRNVKDLLQWYGTSQQPEFELPMDQQVGFVNKLDVAAFRQKIIEAEKELDGNVPRSRSRQDGENGVLGRRTSA